MEKIKINAIEPKFGKPNDKGVCTPFWAINYNESLTATVWDNQIADYMMKDVGIGGTCLVELKKKDQFTNIRSIDMDSAGVGQVLKEVQNGERSLNGQEQKPMVNEGAANVARILTTGYNKDKSIIAQCLVKAVIGQPTAQREVIPIEIAVRMYEEALELLNGK